MNKELDAYMKENNLTPLKAFQKYREKDIKNFAEFTWIIKIIETALEDYEEHEEILKDYDFNLANFREACFTLAQFRGSGFTNIEKKLKTLDIIKDLFDFDFALRFGSNQPMLMITNKRKNEYWELPIPKEKYDLLKEVLGCN